MLCKQGRKGMKIKKKYGEDRENNSKVDTMND
jgi:hypothetical protein